MCRGRGRRLGAGDCTLWSDPVSIIQREGNRAVGFMLYLCFPVGGGAGLCRLLFERIVNNNSYPIIPLPSQLSCYKKTGHTDNFGIFLKGTAPD